MKTVLTVALRVASSALSLATVAMCIRTYDSSDSAFLLLYISFFNFASVFIRIGLDAYVVKLSSTNFLHRTRQLFSALICVSVLQLALMTVPAVSTLVYFDVSVSTAFIMSFSMFFVSLLGMIGDIYQARGHFGHMISVKSYVIYIPLLAAVLFKKQPADIMAIHLASNALFFVISVFHLHRSGILTGGRTRMRRVLAVVRRLYVASSNLFVTKLANSLSNWGILFFLPMALSATSFEIFAFAQRLSTSALFLLEAVSIVASPRLALLFHKSRISDLNILLRRVRYVGLGSAAAMFVVVFLSLDHVLSYMRLPLQESYIPVYALLLARAITAALGPTGVLLVFIGEHAFLSSVTLVTSAAMLGSIMATAHYWGASGAALAFLATSTVQRLLLYWRCRERLQRGESDVPLVR